MKAIMKLLIICAIGFFILYKFIGSDAADFVESINNGFTKTTIKEVVAQPNKFGYAKVAGKVNESINVFGLSGYKLSDLEDSEYELVVIPMTSKSVPKEGNVVTVKGKVKQVLKINQLELIAIEEMEHIEN